ncbi:MAG: polysaccharide biosynthesis/export family protein [Verrucomicrobiota bacterium]|nr:polysaccharide biosynthesis/export family protein [Verrucomicrobiota bacterium]
MRPAQASLSSLLKFAAFVSAVIFTGASAIAQSPAPPAATPELARAAISVPTAPPQGGAVANSNVVSAPSGYTLSANDQVAIEVYGEDDLRTNARLSADGSISLPLLGAVKLGGLTLPQASSRLTELYGRDYLVNPKVNVSLASYAKRRFTMLGQVNRPGSFEMPEGSASGIDLLEAVAMAGGYTRIAAPERISVRRKGANGDEVLRVNGKQLAKSSGGGFRVQPGDTVTVGESIF